MQAVNPEVESDIQMALADESATALSIEASDADRSPPLTVIDARRIIDCLRENSQFHTLEIFSHDMDNDDVLNAFRSGLPLCTSITTVNLCGTHLGNEGLEHLLPAFYNTSVTSLYLAMYSTQGQRGSEFIRDLLVGNNSLCELHLCANFNMSPDVAIGLGQGLAINNRLQKLYMSQFHNIGNEGLEHMVSAFGDMKNNSLTELNLNNNNIQGAEGCRQVTFLLLCFPSLKVLVLSNNRLGPLGARALAPGLATASNLERLELSVCRLGNDGVANLVPDGQVNRSLTNLDLCYNDIRYCVGGENLLVLASRCANLDRLEVDENVLSSDHQHRLNLLLDRKRLYNEAQALGGAPSAVVFEKLVQANFHEHGLSASFVILRDYIFADQQTSARSEGERMVQAGGVKRKR
jgi:hypothetical protein